MNETGSKQVLGGIDQVGLFVSLRAKSVNVRTIESLRDKVTKDCSIERRRMVFEEIRLLFDGEVVEEMCGSLLRRPLRFFQTHRLASSLTTFGPRLLETISPLECCDRESQLDMNNFYHF